MTHKKRITKIIAGVLSVVMVFGVFAFIAPIEAQAISLDATDTGFYNIAYETNGDTTFGAGAQIRVINTTRNGKNKSDAVYQFDGAMDWEPVGETYVVWDGITDNTFYGIYPYNAEYNSFTIPTNQSGGVEDADWMTATYTSYKGEGSVKFHFEHRLAKVTVNITNWNNEFDGAAQVIDNQLIYTKGIEVAANYENGVAISTKDNITGIDPHVDDTSYTAIVAPAVYNASDKFMTFTVDGKEMTVLATASQLTEGLEPGNHYTFDLTVGKDVVEITEVKVNGWKEEDMNGGVAEEIHYEYDAETNTYIVDNAEGLQQWNKKVQEVFATAVDGGSPLLEYAEDFPNLTLEADITLTGENNWTPLGGSNRHRQNRRHYRF